MKIKKIEVSLGRTINLGNFESARVDVTMAAQIDEGDVLTDCYKLLREHVDEKLSLEVDAVSPHGINIPPHGE